MLAKAERPTFDFADLATYLVNGTERPVNPKRVAWQFAQNLPFDDPKLVAKMMAATAELSARCKNPCYHVMIAWERSERPEPAAMRHVAEAALALMGLAEHQALVMGHGDKDHPHLHMMINRVHPDTGRAWSTSHDWRRWDRVMKELSEAHGFRFVPSHRFNPELTEDMEKGPTSPAWRAARRGAATGRPQWSRRRTQLFAERISEDLDAASTWDDLTDLIAEHDMAIEAKGTGFVVGNKAGYAKLSALGFQVTAKGQLTRRPPPRKKDKPRRGRPWVDAVDVARGLAGLGLADNVVVRSAVQEAHGKRLARVARLPFIDQLLHDLKKHLKASTAQTAPVPRRRKRRSVYSARKLTRGAQSHRQ